MFKFLKEMLFGEWVRIYTNPNIDCIKKYHDPVFGEVRTQCVLIVERNVKTGKERAYTKKPTGDTTYWDMDYVKANFDIYEDVNE